LPALQCNLLVYIANSFTAVSIVESIIQYEICAAAANKLMLRLNWGLRLRLILRAEAGG
jgi:hypothetical protein